MGQPWRMQTMAGGTKETCPHNFASATRGIIARDVVRRERTSVNVVWQDACGFGET